MGTAWWRILGVPVTRIHKFGRRGRGERWNWTYL
jgi:hypothetical protein